MSGRVDPSGLNGLASISELYLLILLFRPLFYLCYLGSAYVYLCYLEYKNFMDYITIAIDILSIFKCQMNEKLLFLTLP